MNELLAHPSDPDLPPKPTFPAEYREWLWDRHGVSVGPDVAAEYQSISSQLAREFEGSPFWNALPNRLDALAANYLVRRGVPLLVPSGSRPDLDVKSWESFWEKTYRLNVLGNPAWDREPPRGWVLPETWFAQVSDMVRTRLVVKYLEGSSLVADEIVSIAGDLGLRTNIGRLAKEEGYYATHVDIHFPISVSNGLDVEVVNTRVEIQVSTELQNNIYDLAHRLYATRRMMDAEDVEEWQWNYRSDEFASNYLGHVLHYLEGMIMRIREGFDDRRS